MNLIDTDKLIKEGIKKLSILQLDSGYFESLTDSDKKFTYPSKREAIFETALILSAINSLPESIELKKVKQSISKFLLSQKSDFWSFNYWIRDSKDFRKEPYPDDLDDTFCALSALRSYSPKLLTGRVTAKIVNLLAALEKEEGGPYFTWIIQSDSEAWKDIDLAVNSNIAYFLSLEGVSLKSINYLVEKAIDDNNYHSPYYASPYSVIYFISRFYSGDKKSQIINFLISKKNKKGFWNNPLDTALAVSSLINLGFKDINEIEKANDYLKTSSKADSWKPYPFVIENKKDGKIKYAGSAALTGSFCLEAIHKFFAIKNNPNDKLEKTKIGISEDIYQKIIETTDNRFDKLSLDLKKQFKKIRGKILDKAGGKEIMLVSAYFREAFGVSKKISNDLIVRLGAINLYGWIAYTIYDDFLDEEGDPKLISLANICLKEVALELKDLSTNHSFDIAKKILDKIDEANIWEVLNCRENVVKNKLAITHNLPSYGQFKKLADRSLGHAIGPLVILSFLGFEKNSFEIKNIYSFFENYIIARQLNDDARDFEDDLKKGHLSPVVSLVVKEWLKKHESREINLDIDLPELQKIFWDVVLPIISKSVLSNLERARALVKNTDIVSKKSLLYSLLEPIKKSTLGALNERKEMVDFLSEFN